MHSVIFDFGFLKIRMRAHALEKNYIESKFLLDLSPVNF